MTHLYEHTENMAPSDSLVIFSSDWERLLECQNVSIKFLFWLRKTSLSVKTYQLSFSELFFVSFIWRALHFFSKSFPFLFLFFCIILTSILQNGFTLFWMKKTAVPVEISRYSFRVFVCACPSVISSIPGKSFHFPFP